MKALAGAMLLCLCATVSWAKPLSNLVMRPDGIGKLAIGMNVGQAEKALGYSPTFYPNVTKDCDQATIGNGLEMMVENGEITRITAAGKQYRTLEGITIGDGEERVFRVYKASLDSESINRDSETKGYYFTEMVIRPHTYNESGHYIEVKDDRGMGYMIETDDKHKVMYIHAGKFPSVTYVEGCL